MADQSGNTPSSAAYESFGNSTNSLGTRYQFTGREKDDFSGLHYYRARWYDASLGRFISEDPIGFEGGDLNLFGYVNNNSINKIDPTGLLPYDDWKAINAFWNWGEEYFCQDLAPDFFQVNIGFGGLGGSLTLTRDGDVFGGLDGNPFDSGRMMYEGFRGGKVGFGLSVSAQKIFKQGRLTREDRQDIVGGTSFSGNAGYGFMVNGQMSPTDKMGNIYSGGTGLGKGFNFGLGGGISNKEPIFELPITWGAPPPKRPGGCNCSER